MSSKPKPYTEAEIVYRRKFPNVSPHHSDEASRWREERDRWLATLDAERAKREEAERERDEALALLGEARVRSKRRTMPSPDNPDKSTGLWCAHGYAYPTEDPDWDGGPWLTDAKGANPSCPDPLCSDKTNMKDVVDLQDEENLLRFVERKRWERDDG